jgi:hypothetical protein
MPRLAFLAKLDEQVAVMCWTKRVQAIAPPPELANRTARRLRRSNHNVIELSRRGKEGFNSSFVGRVQHGGAHMPADPASSFVWLRDAIATSAPSPAKAVAVAAPMPELLPTINTFFDSRLLMFKHPHDVRQRRLE